MSNDLTPIDCLNRLLEPFDKALEELANYIEPCAHAAKSMDTNGKIDMYIKLELLKKRLEGLITSANIHQPELAELASKEMLQSDTESIVRNGYTISPDIKTYVSVNKDDKPYIVQWLDKHPQGKELVSRDFNANAFSAFIRGLTQEQGYSHESGDIDKKLPSEIKMHDKPILALRKKRGS